MRKRNYYQTLDFVCVKETSQGDVSFMHPKHMLLLRDIKKDHELVLFPESSLSVPNLFRIKENLKNQS